MAELDETSPVPPHARLHGGGRIDSVLDYLAFVATNKPLTVLLDEAPKKIAACVEADVASLYLLEGDGHALVMRGNVGFPAGSRGKVRLTVGEGITGKAVELRYPISTEKAEHHESFRGFPELHEERFPVFLAVPILGTRGPLGAVAVQRSDPSRPFTEAEVSLLAALTAPITSGLRLARLLDDLREGPPRSGGGTQKLTLAGTPVVAGRAIGAVAALRRPATSASKPGDESDADALRRALDNAQRALRSVTDRTATLGLREHAGFIDSYLLMCDDQRLRRTAFEAIARGNSLATALGDVARHAARSASTQQDPFLIERARDLEQLCDALLMMASPDPRAALPSRAIVVAERLSIYDLLVTARAQPAGIIVTSQSGLEVDRTRVLLELLGVPSITGVTNALQWMVPGDIVLLDAFSGLVIVNPTRSDIAAYRADRKSDR